MEKYTVLLNDKRTIETEKGKTILLALRENHIFLPSACNGKGACGQCKIKVKKGIEKPFNTKENFHLSDKQKELNYRLACQHTVEKDLEIDISEELLFSRHYRAKITKLRDLTYDIKEVTMELIEPDVIKFRAGQYIQFEVPPYEKSPEKVYRPYSIASSPAETRFVELEVRYVNDGIATTYIHNHLREGDEVCIDGPFGGFHLRDNDRDIVFIAGGSGMAPVKSILLDMLNKQTKRKAKYFFGAVTQKDLFLADDMKMLENQLYDFKFIPALSKPLPEDNWQGETGLITEVVDRHLETGENLEAYLCGSPAMINACVKVLKSKGISEDLIFYDRFS
jgi:Na+-transporting NADH:ubiquinone oxidoreductase subunit F